MFSCPEQSLSTTSSTAVNAAVDAAAAPPTVEAALKRRIAALTTTAVEQNGTISAQRDIITELESELERLRAAVTLQQRHEDYSGAGVVPPRPSEGGAAAGARQQPDRGDTGAGGKRGRRFCWCCQS